MGGTGQAVQGVFTGTGAVVGGILGGVFGGAAALFGYPPSYAYGAPFAAPFNATGSRPQRRSSRSAALSDAAACGRWLLSRFPDMSSLALAAAVAWSSVGIGKIHAEESRDCLESRKRSGGEERCVRSSRVSGGGGPRSIQG